MARQAMGEAVGDSIRPTWWVTHPGSLLRAKTGAGDGRAARAPTLPSSTMAGWNPELESRYKDYKWLTKVRARVSRRLFSRSVSARRRSRREWR